MDGWIRAFTASLPSICAPLFKVGHAIFRYGAYHLKQVQIFQMDPLIFHHAHLMPGWQAPWLGVDVVQISGVRASLAAFGERFVRRLFTQAEAAYAGQSDELCAERLAVRFAAKEAALKAFGWCHQGIGWRQLEVHRQADGACLLWLHGRAAELAQSQGLTQWALSLSHDGDHAVAVVAGIHTLTSKISDT